MADHPTTPSRRAGGVALLVAVLLGAGAACSGDDGTATPEQTAPTTEGTTPRLAEPTEALVIAHRGASADAPEHTFAAWDLAVEQGADHLELDLQVTADGELVVLHDPTLDRTARGPAEACTGEVATKTLDQLGQCEVGSWFNEAFPEKADPGYEGLRIPTLAEVLDRYGTEQRYYIETKATAAGMEEQLVALLEEAGMVGPTAEPGQVILQSFEQQSLRTLHELDPGLPLVLLLRADPSMVTPQVLEQVATYAVGIGPPAAVVDATIVADAHARCLAVHPYTVDDPARMAELLDLGVDGMFTNRPAELVAVRDAHAPPPDHC